MKLAFVYFFTQYSSLLLLEKHYSLSSTCFICSGATAPNFTIQIERQDKVEQLLSTKFYIPSTRRKLVSRPRLVERINQGLHRRLTLISAPAGFGKTTLVGEWVEQSRSDDQNEFSIAWLSLDESDNDPVRFLSYLITAFKNAEGVADTLGDGALSMLQTPQPPPTETILTALINDISALSGKIVLVLDDYHLISQTDIDDALTFLLEHLPPQLHLILITRVDPQLPLARLLAGSQLNELRATDLRFSSSEATKFLNQVMGLDLSAKDITELETRTEGWIAGLQLAAISMQGREDTSSMIRSFTGSHRLVLDYLIEEVLNHQSESTLSFLLKTSILKQMTGPLCNHLTGRPDSQATLEDLERANLFIIPLDNERRWYRYHHLFADLLRAQLQKLHSAEVIEKLHICAAEWHGVNGSVTDAILHASLASDAERVERFIHQNYKELVRSGEICKVRFWISKLSKELVYNRPWLCIYAAFSHAWYGNLTEADLLLDKAEKSILSEKSTPDIKYLQAYHAYVRSRVTAMQGDIPRAIKYCLAAQEYNQKNNIDFQLDTLILLGYEYYLNGEFPKASQTLNEMIELGKNAGAVINTVTASCVLARLLAIQGLLHQPFDVYQQAGRYIPKPWDQHHGVKALTEVGIGDLLYEWNNLEKAVVHIEEGLALMHMWEKADDFVLTYTTLAQILLAQGNQSEAIKTIKKATQLIQSRGVFPETRQEVEYVQVKIWLALNDFQAINRWNASQEDRLSPEDPLRFENELKFISRARVLAAQNKLDETIELLYHLERNAESGGRTGRLIEILILQALVMHKLGESTQAFTALERSLVLAEPERYVRIFINEGPPMAQLLYEALDRGISPEYVSRLLRAFPDQEPEQPTSAKPQDPYGKLIEPLTDRECEVLRLIANGLTNQEVAERLFLSMNTVKVHTRNIFGKLNVNSRTQAVIKAKALGLLPPE